MNYRILLVDDEPLVRRSLRRLLSHPGWGIAEAGSGSEALEWLGEHACDVALIDYKLGDCTGMDVLERMRELQPDAVPIMLTAYANIGLAVEAVKKGAFDFLEKEGAPSLTRHVVEKAVERVRLRREVDHLHQDRLAGANLPQVVSRSPAMREILAMVDEFARTAATVLLEGETGTGKSLLAEFIHAASDRSEGPLVAINCGAIPKELIESELFGYAEGAFTGARQKGKPGLIQRADGGTLLLDEIGDLSLDLQSKLLHVLETREFLSVGAVEPTRVDVRFVAATNADLSARIADGRFRRDLYYRLNVAAVRIPPLRERPEDILPLARHFLHRLGDRYGRTVSTIDDAAGRRLESHGWPGNVREVRNVIERSLLLLKGDTLTAGDLRFMGDGPCTADERGEGCSQLRVRFGSGEDLLQDVVRQLVLQAWERSEQNQTQAARLLGIPRTTFQTYVQKYGLC